MKNSDLTRRSSLSAAPPYSPELQPAERLWPLTKEGVANQCFTNLEALTTMQRQCCEPLQHSPQAIRNLTLFHGWPEQSNDRCLTESNVLVPIRFERRKHECVILYRDDVRWVERVNSCAHFVFPQEHAVKWGAMLEHEITV